jgi:predicted DNA-binding transcriptional regulator YafY
MNGGRVQVAFSGEGHMGIIKDILGEIIKIDFKPKAGQMGLFNIQTAKNTYINPLVFTTSEAAKAFAEGLKSGNQAIIVENAEKILSANTAILKVMPESEAVKNANAAVVASTATVSGVENAVKITAIETLAIQKSAASKAKVEPKR